MTLFNLFWIFSSCVLTMIIAAMRGHWNEFGLLLGLTFASGFALYMVFLSL